MLLPNVSNPMALDFEATIVIDQAIAEKSGLINNEESRFYRESMNKAVRLANFSKVGVLWVIISLIWALAFRPPMSPVILLSMLFSVCFVILGFLSFAQQTYWFILEKEREGNLAIKILYSKNIRPSGGQERNQELERAFENSVEHSGRLVHLSWGSLENYRRVYRTFFRYPRKYR